MTVGRERAGETDRAVWRRHGDGDGVQVGSRRTVLESSAEQQQQAQEWSPIVDFDLMR